MFGIMDGMKERGVSLGLLLYYKLNNIFISKKYVYATPEWFF
jgi:hypothetical protein